MDISANLSHVCPRGYCPDFVPLYSWPTLADLYGCMCLWNHTLSFLVKNMSVVHYYIGPVHTVSYHQVSWSALLDLFCTNCVNSLPVSRAPNHFRNSGALPLFLLEESESKFSSSAILPRAKKVSALVILSDSPGTIRQNYSSSTECPWLVHCYNLYSFFHIVGQFFSAPTDFVHFHTCSPDAALTWGHLSDSNCTHAKVLNGVKCHETECAQGKSPSSFWAKGHTRDDLFSFEWSHNRQTTI